MRLPTLIGSTTSSTSTASATAALARDTSTAGSSPYSSAKSCTITVTSPITSWLDASDVHSRKSSGMMNFPSPATERSWSWKSMAPVSRSITAYESTFCVGDGSVASWRKISFAEPFTSWIKACLRGRSTMAKRRLPSPSNASA